MQIEPHRCRACRTIRLHRVIDGVDLVDLIGLDAVGPRYPGTWYTALLICAECGQVTYLATLLSQAPAEIRALSHKMEVYR